MTSYVRVRQDVLGLYISESIFRAAENWNMFRDDTLLRAFKDEILGDVVSELRENGYIDE